VVQSVTMLGERFFDWVDRPATASTYEEVLAALTDGSFAEILGADAVRVCEHDGAGRLQASHGNAGDGPPLETTLDQCSAGTIRLRAFSINGFSETAADRFRVAGLLICAHLRRICSELYDRRVRERLFLTRKETQAAAFIVHGRTVTPYNPSAVAYCDAHWGADEVQHTLTEEQAAEFWKTLAASWRNPVDPQWTVVSLDIGGGVTDVHTIGRHDGGAVVMFTPPRREAPPTEIPMLTRRQRDIMEWIAEGKTSAEAGIILDISPRTVEKHLEAVFQRFGVENRVAAVRTYLDLKNGRDPRVSSINA